MAGIKVTLDQLARYLTGMRFGGAAGIDRPVVNMTGLTGEYDFALEWTPGIGVDSGDSAPSLFTTIQEQLGLKLEPQKGPVAVTVIDRAALPAEN